MLIHIPTISIIEFVYIRTCVENTIKYMKNKRNCWQSANALHHYSSFGQQKKALIVFIMLSKVNSLYMSDITDSNAAEYIFLFL